MEQKFKTPDPIIAKVTTKDIQNTDGSWDYETEEEARDAFNRGVISQGQLDDFVLNQLNNYPALSQLKKKIGDILTTKSGRNYRIDKPLDTKGLKTWGKDHILLRELDENGQDVFDFGSYGWFPIGDFLKK